MSPELTVKASSHYHATMSQSTRLHTYSNPTQVLRERAEAILWIKTQMARHGLQFEDLKRAGCFDEHASAGSTSSAQARFRDAQGHVWDGQGALPAWLQRAVNAGQSVEHFRVDI